jgi:hypothetical protein
LYADRPFVRKSRDHRFANRNKPGARTFCAGTLAADAGALDQKPKGVGEKFGLRNTSVAAELDQPITLGRLEFFDDVPRRVITFRKLDCCIGHVTPAAIVARTFRANPNPRMQLCDKIIGVFGLEFFPYFVGLAAKVTQTFGYQFVLRTEVTIERHFVGACSLRDRIDADAPDAVFAKEIARGADNAFAGPQQGYATIDHDCSSGCEKMSLSLDGV